MNMLASRLAAHRLVDPPAATVADVVRWMGAVQAQDYAGARWGVAQRTQAVSAEEVDRALADGEIIRTHVMRPTWHLVAAADLRWLLALTAARVKAQAAYSFRQSGLDAQTIAASNRVLATTLVGRALTRAEVEVELRRAGVPPRNAVATGHLLLAAELDAVVCSGALRGKAHTYALLDERVPVSSPLDREAALAQLAERYFASHGPATIRDFAWWAGLSITDARDGTRSAEPPLESIGDGHSTYWFTATARKVPPRTILSAQLLSNFDEYTVGYADRSMLISTADTALLEPRPELLFNNVVLIEGRVAGTWKRAERRAAVTVRVRLFRPLGKRRETAIARAVRRYAAHLELAAELERGFYEAGSAPSDARSMTNR